MTDIAHTSATGSRVSLAYMLDRIVAFCGIIPYALVALVLRFVMARVFFLSGQSKIEGPSFPLNIQDFDLSVTLPMGLKDATLRLFEAKFAALPVPSALLAYVFTYAEFILPICLVLGFATRFSALFLLAMTVMLQLYVMPEALWTTHIYWESILLVLMSAGPGAVSIDHVVRYLYQK
jgi:putative oxidoreductase